MEIRVRINTSALRVLLVRRNMSQNVLAMRTGMSSGYLSQLMRGIRRPSPRARQRIMDALGIGFDDVFVIERDEDDAAAE